LDLTMSLEVLAALFGVGLAVGLVSGLIGIGGGVLMVPFLYFFYAHPGWSGVQVAPALQAVVAHATSLFIIVPTAIAGTWSYHRKGLVAWRAALPVAVVSLVAAVIGARLAVALPSAALKVAFGVLLVGSAVRMGMGGGGEAEGALRLTPAKVALTGIAVGLLSAFLGVGGGLIAIPLLVHLVGLDLRRVAATSLAIVLFTAAAGVATYVAMGAGLPGLPAGSWGYVHTAAALPMLVGAVLSVRAGAWANQRLPVAALRWTFAVVFVLLGAQLIWENVPALGIG
jgi:uncharacterized protein